MFPPKRSQVQNQRGVEYVCLRRLSSQIAAQRWVPCPTNKGVSYTNLVSGLAVTLKMDIIIIIIMKSNEGETTLKHPKSFHGNIKNLSKSMKMKNKGECHFYFKNLALP